MYWCEANDLSINVNKCFQIKFSRSKSPIHFTYKINKKTLTLVNHVKDLEITLSNNLSSTRTKHTTDMYCKAMRMLWFMCRNACKFNDPASWKI